MLFRPTTAAQCRCQLPSEAIADITRFLAENAASYFSFYDRRFAPPIKRAGFQVRTTTQAPAFPKGWVRDRIAPL